MTTDSLSDRFNEAKYENPCLSQAEYLEHFQPEPFEQTDHDSPYVSKYSDQMFAKYEAIRLLRTLTGPQLYSVIASVTNFRLAGPMDWAQPGEKMTARLQVRLSVSDFLKLEAQATRNRLTISRQIHMIVERWTFYQGSRLHLTVPASDEKLTRKVWCRVHPSLVNCIDQQAQENKLGRSGFLRALVLQAVSQKQS